jgi:hypothetical protein
MTIHARDIASLRLLARYRILFYKAWSVGIFGVPGKTVGAAASDLAKKGFLKIHNRELPGNITYVTPTEKTAQAITAMPLDRASPKGQIALTQAVAVLYFCVLDTQPRHRLEPIEVGPLVENLKFSPNVIHVASAELGTPCVYRVLLTKDAQHIQRELSAEQRALDKSKKLQHCVHDRTYGWALLAPTRAAVEAITRQVAAGKLGRDIPLIVGLGPTTETLSQALKG